MRGSHGLGTNCVFFFVYNCMLWAILCFASTTSLPGIASPNQRLVLCNQLGTDAPTWDTVSHRESCHDATLTVARFPLTGGTAPGPHRVVPSTSHATGNRIGWIPYSLRGGHTSQGQDQCSKSTYLAGCGVSLRSDTLCYFVAPPQTDTILGR